MNSELLGVLVDLAQIATGAVAIISLIFVWSQVKQLKDQFRSDRLLSLYKDLDTPEAQADRKFIYKVFSKTAKPTEMQVKRARRVLASFDRMSYQVSRNFVDRKSAHDLYGRVLMRVMLSTWRWLENDSRERNDPKGREYCGNAERLAKEFAVENLRDFKKWKSSYNALSVPELLKASLEAHVQDRNKK